MLSSIDFAERATGTLAAADSQAAPPNRTALAFSYPEGVKTYIKMMGTFVIPQASSELRIEVAYVKLAREDMRLAERARSLAMERASQKGRC
jgi:hypothetical protein